MDENCGEERTTLADRFDGPNGARIKDAAKRTVEIRMIRPSVTKDTMYVAFTIFLSLIHQSHSIDKSFLL